MKIRTFLIQNLITLSLFIILSTLFFELFPRFTKLFTSKKKNNNAICYEQLILGKYFKKASCPNNTYINYPNNDAPSMKLVKSCTDSIGGRVDCNEGTKIFNSNDYQTFLIGDSFIQADELEYKDSVYGLINNDPKLSYFRAYGFGYASWNTRQYLKSIQLINKKNSYYDIYFFPNDVIPNYHGSTFQENTKTKSINSNKLQRNKFKVFLSKSLTIQKILEVRLRLVYFYNQINQKNEFWRSHEKVVFGQCPTSNDKRLIDKFTLLARDYVNYSYHYDCWDALYRDAYKLVKEDLDDIVNYGNSLNSDVRIIFIPPGFSFKNENTPGRLNPSYNFPDNISLSLLGLRQKLKEDFGNRFFDLEVPLQKKIKQIKENCNSRCNNLFYYAHDGHFNKEGHKLLFDELYKK